MASSASQPTGNRPKAILFDWDNTLVDSWPVIHDALNTTLTAYGLEPWTLAETKLKVRKSMRNSFPALFGDQWEEAGEVFYERYAAIHMEKIVPIPNVEEMLATLASENIYLGVVSNKLGEYLRQEAGQFGWDRFFGKMVGAFDAENDKPAPDPVTLALDGSGGSPGNAVWFVGDADIDMECAANSGCIPVLIRPEAPKNGEFPVHAPKWHFNECLALCKHLQNL